MIATNRAEQDKQLNYILADRARLQKQNEEALGALRLANEELHRVRARMEILLAENVALRNTIVENASAHKCAERRKMLKVLEGDDIIEVPLEQASKTRHHSTTAQPDANPQLHCASCSCLCPPPHVSTRDAETSPLSWRSPSPSQRAPPRLASSSGASLPTTPTGSSAISGFDCTHMFGTPPTPGSRWDYRQRGRIKQIAHDRSSVRPHHEQAYGDARARGGALESSWPGPEQDMLGKANTAHELLAQVLDEAVSYQHKIVDLAGLLEDYERQDSCPLASKNAPYE